ncbi:MAG: pilus assembly PilX N-terminal domain-containing protein, partial [candidate division Zixibacteria bacterium]|nr:pilus assembly PilX N-terminal domain-containing protein [candidate division Zixibacteria bacterium]
MVRRLRKDDGSALLVALMVMLMLTLIFVAAITTSVTDIDIAKNQKERTSAFYTAEAGLELALRVLKDNIDQLDNDTLKTLINATTSLGEGAFSVEVSGTSPYKTLTSDGFYRDGHTIIEVMVRRRRNPLCIWDNIIFAGSGQAGKVINGNVSMHGSIHLLGDTTTGEAVSFDLSGNAHQYNNYSGISAALSSRVPPLDTITFNGEVVQTLDAELRVRHGQVDVSGFASIGFPDAPGGSPQVKETLDGCYVTDGYGGNKGTSSVHSDNGTTEGYDLGDELSFPDLSDSYTDPNTGITYPTYMNYLQSNALVIGGDLTLKPGQELPAISNGFGSIYMDASGNLQIDGIVYVTGDINIESGNGGMKSTPIIFDGRGTLVSELDISVSTHVLSQGTFPIDDVLGFIAADDVEIGCGSGDAHLNIMGAFFAQDQISNAKQNQLAGAMVSNYFDIKNVPDLFHIPSIVENLPPG